MSRSRRSSALKPPGRTTHLLAVAVLVPGLLSATVARGAAQANYASPEFGWSQVRGPTVGARVGRELIGGLDVVLHGLVSFPREGRVVDRPARADRSAWRTSAALLYHFDRQRALAPYVGAGGRYGRATLSVVADGYRAGEVRSGFGLDLVGGIRLPRLPASPWLEYRKVGELWSLTGGIQLRFGTPGAGR